LKRLAKLTCRYAAFPALKSRAKFTPPLRGVYSTPNGFIICRLIIRRCRRGL
jgi:hypothetical protein